MELIPFGKITKTHGVKGELKILPYSRRLDNLSTIERLYIKLGDRQKPLELTILHRKYHKNTAIVKLDGIDSVEEAQTLASKEVLVDKADLSELENDEYYWNDLIGLEVVTEEGKQIGTVKTLLDNAMQSTLVVTKDSNEILVPFTEPFIVSVDLDNSRIVISPIPGLLDL